MSAWLLPLCVAVPFVIATFNLFTWRRPRPRPTPSRASPRVSILIPARNEAHRLGPTLAAALHDQPDVLELIVYDDQSTDRTAALVHEWAQRDDRVRIVSGSTLPVGWVGKPHACHRLAELARGEYLLFLDADVRLEAGAVAGLLAALDGTRHDFGVLSLVPRQEMGSFFERLVLPLLVLTYVSWLPLRLVEWGRDPRLVAANGQILFVTRGAHDRIGGFASVAAEIVDDVAFCRRAKVCGEKVSFQDGTSVARCRMYDSPRAVWRGFSKNVFEGVGSTVGLAVALALYFVCYLAPFLVCLGAALVDPRWLLPSGVAVALIVILRAALVWRFRQPIEGILLHPLSLLAFFAIAGNSWLWHLRGRIEWAGRSYPSSADRSRVGVSSGLPKATEAKEFG